MPKYEVISVIPEVFEPYMGASILGKARERDIFEFKAHDLREWTHDRHHTVDDAPFGGGAGMLMKPEPIFEAVETLISRAESSPHVVFFSPAGVPFTQECAQRLSKLNHIVFVCGRYEGMDERVYSLADEVLSLGDFVLSGGELAAMCVIDATVRLLPGALGDEMSSQEESFSDGLLEYAQYTRPASFKDMDVPEVLLSGNHGSIAEWRHNNSLERTYAWRPDLLENAHLSLEDRDYLESIQKTDALSYGVSPQKAADEEEEQ